MLMKSIEDIRYQGQEIEKIYNMNEIIYDATQEKNTEIDRTLWDYFRTGCRVYFEHPYISANFAFDSFSEQQKIKDKFPIRLKNIEFLTLHDYIQQDNFRTKSGLKKYEIQVPLYYPTRGSYDDKTKTWSYKYTFVQNIPYPKNLNQDGTIYFELYYKYNEETNYKDYYMYIITTGTKILLPNDLSFFFTFKRNITQFFDYQYYSEDYTSVSLNLQSIKFNNIVKIKNNQDPVNLLCFCAWNHNLSYIDFDSLEIHKTNNLQQSFHHNSLINLNMGNITTLPNTKMFWTFKQSYSLTSLDLSNLDTSNVENMEFTFEQCTSLTSLDLSNFNTSNAKLMKGMFYDCTSLTSLDLSNFDTSNIEDMGEMFYNCSSLTSLDLSNFDTSNVKDMQYMFEKCTSLTSLDLSNFNTSNVEDLLGAFYDCTSLTSLDLSNFDTSNVEYMDLMFYNCTSLTSLDLSNFDTSNVKDMEYMFYNCSSLTSLDLSNFDTSNVQGDGDIVFWGTGGFNNMFQGCNSLTSLNISSFSTLKDYISTREMFSDCTSLVSLDLSNFYIPNMAYNSQMFYNCTSLSTINMSNFIFGNQANKMFENCISLTNIILNNANGTKLKYANNMFCNCLSLENIDFSCFIHLGETKYMFQNCSSLLSLYFPNNWSCVLSNTPEFLNCENMFENCIKLNEVTMPLAKNGSCKSLFKNCESLETINFFSSLSDLPEIVNMEGDFSNFCKNCYNLKTINLPNSTTNKIKFLQLWHTTSAFENCYNLNIDNILSHIALCNFDHPDSLPYNSSGPYSSRYVYNCEATFKNCYQLTKFDSVMNFPSFYREILLNPDTPIKINFKSCFENCINLIKVATKINCSVLRSNETQEDRELVSKPDLLVYIDMFKECSSLTDIYLYGFYYYHRTPHEGYSIKGMFDNCINLQNIYTTNSFPYNQPIDNYYIEKESEYNPSSAFINCTQIYNWEGEKSSAAQVIHANPNMNYSYSAKGYLQYGSRETIFPEEN